AQFAWGRYRRQDRTRPDAPPQRRRRPGAGRECPGHWHGRVRATPTRACHSGRDHRARCSTARDPRPRATWLPGAQPAAGEGGPRRRRRDGHGHRRRQPGGGGRAAPGGCDPGLEWPAGPKHSDAAACAGSGQRRLHHHAVAEARRRARRDETDGGRKASRLNASTPRESIVIALEIADPMLSERLAAALADVPGVRVARHGEAADVALVAAGTTVPADADAALTRREFEVLALMAEGASNKA